MASEFRIDLLGGFRLSVQGVPATAPISSRGQELLALLVLDGNRVARERVASRLWPESSEAQARTNLRRELHQLRRALPQSERAIDAAGAHLALRTDGPVRSDVHDIRRALARVASIRSNERGEVDEVAALADVGRGYGGDLMPECFSEWLTLEREHLREDVVRGLRRLVELLEQRRDLGEAIRWARRLTEIDRLDEIAYRAQMRLYVAGSDRAAAVRAFHRCANLLDQELGVEPERETRALYEKLVHSSEAPPPPAAGLVSPRAPGTPAFHGRSQEVDRLLRAWRSTQGAGPHVACIVGEPGIGKSRLADEVARQAEREGARVVRARAYPAEGQLSYAPVVEWLRSPAVASHLVDLDAVWQAELGRLLPEAHGASASSRSAEAILTGGDDAYARRRLFEAVARALLAGSRPLVVVLDDLQWCDPETLALLHYVSRREAAAPVFVLATARSDALADNEAARRLWLALEQDGRLLELELGPLDATELAALLRAAAGGERGDVDAAAAERLYRLSEGNPLFALEALRANLHLRAADPALDEPVPGELLASSPRVRGVLAARFAQLDPRARELAQCAATIGRAFDLDVLREAADLEEPELVSALDELWRRRIVREHSTVGYDFSHDALREVATHGVSSARARLLHRRVAQALELVHATNLDDLSASMAAHYTFAGLPERAIKYYRRAASVAVGVYAHDRAAELLERALSLVGARPPSRDRDREELSLLLERAPSLRALHGYTDSRLLVVLERARRLAEELDDSAALFHVLRNLWALRFVEGNLKVTLEIAGRMSELAAVLPDLEAVSHHALAGALTHTGELGAALEHFEAARRGYDRKDTLQQLSVFGSDFRVFNSAWGAHALWLHGLEDRAVASADEAVHLARSLRHAYSEALACAYAAVLHYMRGDRRACAVAADAARELCRRYGFAYYGHWGTTLGAWARHDGDPDAAARAIVDALASLDREGSWARRPLYLAALAEVLGAAGRSVEAAEVLDQAEARVASSGDRLWSSELARLRAVLVPEQAIASARRALELAQAMRARPLALRSAVTLAEAMRRKRDGPEAAEIVREALAGLPEGGNSFDRDRALRLLATFDCRA